MRSVNSKPNRTGAGAKLNYTEVGLGNDKGAIKFGHLHKKGDVTAGVLLQTPDAEHQLSLDIDTPRKGWTTSTSPGVFQVECGSSMKEPENTMILTAVNGDISIKASNGKIRLQGTDIELVAMGEGQTKGNIKLTSSENVIVESKKVLVTAKTMYKIATPGTGQLVANGVLEMYGSIIRGVTDAVASKDSKVGGQKFWQEQNPDKQPYDRYA